MANLNGLPQTTIRHDPWLHANMLGSMVHCVYHVSATAGPSLYVDNTGSNPIMIALSFWGPVAYDASVYTNCSFTGSSQAFQYFVNRYARAAHDITAGYTVKSPLRAFATGSSFSGTQSLKWSAAAGQRLTPFGSNSFTGTFLILDATEKLRFAIDRTDGESDSQDWNIDITWAMWDFNLIGSAGEA